ncbi:YagK/YfjJ domain-containing protein [Serratia fonticola]
MRNTSPFNRTWSLDWFLSHRLNLHIDELVNRYSRLLALRVDLSYQKNTVRYGQQRHRQLESDVRLLMTEMERLSAVVGYFWVIEWTVDHKFHAHVVFWLDGHETQRTFPFAEKAMAFWKAITQQDGSFYRCDFKEEYQADITIPVCYNAPASITNIKRVLSYLAKVEQKEGMFFPFGCNDVPARSAAGRPRKALPTLPR